jgi:hypothetical protein
MPRGLSFTQTEQEASVKELFLAPTRQRGLRDSSGVLEAFLLRRERLRSMQMFAFCYPVLAVSIIYCAWLSYRRVQLCHGRVLRDRVAFMLWTMANQIPQDQPPACAAPDAAPDCGVPAGAQRGRWPAIRQADEREWKKHSQHRGMLQPEDYAVGHDGKDRPDTRPSSPEPAKKLSKHTGLRTPRP